MGILWSIVYNLALRRYNHDPNYFTVHVINTNYMYVECCPLTIVDYRGFSEEIGHVSL